MVEFDPMVLPTRVLLDSFLALHDPTKVRAHGKHAAGRGQYRSCVFVVSSGTASIAQDVIEDCASQLKREVVTEVRVMGTDLSSWFWKAEDRHQRHDEKRNGRNAEVDALSLVDWLEEYGRRAKSVLGSSETINQGIEI